ncbi:MAG TPA: hypothetical protein VG165_02635 [Solirubrobacteraceae bacterium]|jgi:hypothetical protein|nr:hypothetical protein [Solirubrobacteraceae bacterium]
MTDLDRLRAAYPPLLELAPPPATVARMTSVYADDVNATTSSRSQRRWTRPRRIGLLAVGGAIVCGTAVAANGAWHPVLGSAAHGPRPVAASAAVPADQLAALAILRRAQTSRDRGPLVRVALRALSRETINGIHTDAIRVIADRPRELSLLVPVERGGPLNVPGSASIHRNVLCLMSTSYHDAMTQTIEQAGKAETIRYPAGYDGWGITCGNLTTLRTTGIATGSSPSPSGGLIVNGNASQVINRRITLVPDGVARVTVRVRGGHSITVPVHDNVYEYTIHGIQADLGTMWFDADGHRINHSRRG